MPDYNVTIDIGGRQRVVTFDAPPSEADIDDAYHALTTERVPSPDRQPSMSSAPARKPQPAPQPKKMGWVDRAVAQQRGVQPGSLNDVLGVKPKPDPTSYIQPADKVRRDIVKNLPPVKPKVQTTVSKTRLTPKDIGIPDQSPVVTHSPITGTQTYDPASIAKQGNLQSPLGPTGGLLPPSLAPTGDPIADNETEIQYRRMRELTSRALGHGWDQHVFAAFQDSIPESVKTAVGLASIFIPGTLGQVVGSQMGTSLLQGLERDPVGTLESLGDSFNPANAKDPLDFAVRVANAWMAAHGIRSVVSGKLMSQVANVIHGGAPPESIAGLDLTRFPGYLSDRQQVVHEGTNLGPRSFRDKPPTGVQFRNSGHIQASPEVGGATFQTNQGMRGDSTIPSAIQIGRSAARGVDVTSMTGMRKPMPNVQATGMKIVKPGQANPATGPTAQGIPVEPNPVPMGVTGKGKKGPAAPTADVGSTPTTSTTPKIEPAPQNPVTDQVEPPVAPKTGKAPDAPKTAPEAPQSPESFWDANDAAIAALEKQIKRGKSNKRSGMVNIGAADIELLARKSLREARNAGRAVHDVVEEAVSGLKESDAAKVRAMVAALPHGMDYSVPKQATTGQTSPTNAPTVTFGGSVGEPTVREAPSAPRQGKPSEPREAFDTNPNNAGMDKLRSDVGLPEADGRSHKLPNESAGEYSPKNVKAWIKEASDAVNRGVQPRVWSADETNHFNRYIDDLKDRYNQNPSDALSKEIDHATRTFKAVGSPTGQALAARRSHTSGYTAADSIEHFSQEAAEGASMPSDYAPKVKQMGDAWQKQKEKVDAVAQAESEKIAQAEVAKIAAQEKAAKTAVEIDKVVKERQAAAQRVKDKLKNVLKDNTIMSDPFLIKTGGKAAKTLYEIAPDVMKVVRSYIKEGKLRLEHVIAHTARDTGLTKGEVEQIVTGNYDRPTKGLTPEEAKVQELKKKIREESDAVERFKLNRQLENAERKLSELNFERKPKRAWSKELESEVIKLKSLEAQIDDFRKQSVAKANAQTPGSLESTNRVLGIASGVFRKVAGSITSTVASTDASFFGNQGWTGFLTHPGKAARALGQGLKAGVSEANLHNLEGWVRGQEHYNLARASGLEIGEGAGVHDFFVQGILERPGTVQTPVGEIGLNPIRASERAYAGNAKVLRMRWFDSMVKAYESPLFGKKREVSLETAKAFSEFINTMTGVGTGEVGRSLRALNAKAPVLFGPSLLVSRWKMVTGTPLWNAVLRGDARAARMIATEYAKIGGVIYGTTKMLQSFGYDVETDRRSSNFLKIRLRGSDVWVDPWAGLQQPIRVLGQIQAKGYIDKDGNFKDRKALDTLLNSYLKYKVNTSIRLVTDNLDGKDSFTGEPMNLDTGEGWKNNLKAMLPMSVGNIGEVLNANGLSPAQRVTLAVLAIFGANVTDKGRNK